MHLRFIKNGQEETTKMLSIVILTTIQHKNLLKMDYVNLELIKFDITSVDQARMVLKKSWFSDLEIQEI